VVLIGAVGENFLSNDNKKASKISIKKPGNQQETQNYHKLQEAQSRVTPPISNTKTSNQNHKFYLK
jgi:hypothetical protein